MKPNEKALPSDDQLRQIMEAVQSHRHPIIFAPASCFDMIRKMLRPTPTGTVIIEMQAHVHDGLERWSKKLKANHNGTLLIKMPLLSTGWRIRGGCVVVVNDGSFGKDSETITIQSAARVCRLGNDVPVFIINAWLNDPELLAFHVSRDDIEPRLIPEAKFVESKTVYADERNHDVLPAPTNTDDKATE